MWAENITYLAREFLQVCPDVSGEFYLPYLRGLAGEVPNSERKISPSLG